MTNEEAKNLLKGMKDNNNRLLRKSKDVERIAAMELINSALMIAADAIDKIDAMEKSTEEYIVLESDLISRFDNAVDKVLDNYLSEQLAEKIEKEITREFARSFDTRLS